MFNGYKSTYVSSDKPLQKKKGQSWGSDERLDKDQGSINDFQKNQLRLKHSFEL